MILPAIAPTMISIKATEMATRIEIREERSARAIQSAEVNQTFSIASFPPSFQTKNPAARRGCPFKSRLPPPSQPAVGVISPESGAFFWGLHPLQTSAL